MKTVTYRAAQVANRVSGCGGNVLDLDVVAAHEDHARTNVGGEALLLACRRDVARTRANGLLDYGLGFAFALGSIGRGRKDDGGLIVSSTVVVQCTDWGRLGLAA